MLRVEDTDASRVTEEAVRGVLDDLRWLGLDWDEGPEVDARATSRPPTGSPSGSTSIASTPTGSSRRATPTAATAPRRSSRIAPPRRGSGARRPATTVIVATFRREQVAAFETRRPRVRRAVPHARPRVGRRRPREGRGAVRAGQLRDFVLLRSDGSPVFLLAVAVDDLLMGITHVVRGDDLLASAPRNAAVIEALGGTPPRYAHVPQVLGPDRQPLSKRHGSTSVESFREQGYLPEAMVNYLALLGWSAGDDREILRARRAGRRVRPVPRVVQPRGVRHREAHLDEQPLHPDASTTTTSRRDVCTSSPRPA